MGVRSWYAAVMLAFALAAGACSGVDTPADLVPATVDCFSVIDVLNEPPLGYTVVLNVVGFAGSDEAENPLQAVWNEQTGWYGSKTGLLVRSGSTVTLSVPPDVQDRVRIGWGGSPGPWEVRIPGCDRAKEWIVFVGGIGVREPGCVPLTVNDGTSEQQVMIGVGAPCPGQDPPFVPSETTSEAVPDIDCRPAITEAGGFGAEARAESGEGFEVWALIFNTWNLPYGDPVQIPAAQEVKIVWRITGDGDTSIDAVGPDGITVVPDWGPDPHVSSNWNRPGDEWGTGWTFPESGCWTFHVKRGNDMATLTADVFE